MHRSRTSREDSRDYNERDNGSSRGFGAQPTAATNDVVVPVKSRMKEEEIEVPYARESVMERPISSASSRRSNRSSVHERSGARTPRGEAENQEMLSPQTADDREYYDRMSFSSNLTSKSKVQGPTGWDEEREQKIRSEYEFRIAGLERKLGALEGEKSDLARRVGDERERNREWEDEVRGLKEVRDYRIPATDNAASSLTCVESAISAARTGSG